MSELPQLKDILNALDALSPPRSCGEVASDLSLLVQQLKEQGRETEAEQLDYERFACTLTVRAMIYASYNSRTEDTAQQGRVVGSVIYHDGSQWPDPNGFSPEAFHYLSSRAEVTPNPVLKARYHDLIFEKSSLPSKYQSALAAIDAYLESARLFAGTRQAMYQMEMINDMDQAAFLALKIGDKEKINSVVLSLTALIETQTKSTGDEGEVRSPPGRWALELSRILLYVRRSKKYGSLVTDAELTSVKDLTRDLATRNDQTGHAHIARAFLEVASQAARLLSEVEEEYALELVRAEAMVRQGEASEQQGGNGPRHLIAASFYEGATRHYQQMRERLMLTPEQRDDLEGYENALKFRIREMYRAGRNEFSRFEVPIEVPADELEQLLAYLLAPDTLNGCLQRIVTDGSLLPNLDSEQQGDAEAREETPILLRLPKRIIQNDITVSVAETEVQKKAQRDAEDVLLWIQINSGVILTELFSRLQQQKGLNAESLTECLMATGLFDEDNLVLIESGAERFFAGDYISALHILVPQFEDAFRTLFERAGTGVIQPRVGQAGWEVETFGKFLSQDIVRTTLPPELLIYIRLVMTEQAGWNLRNRVAHGLIRPQDCNIVTASTVMHLLLLLTLFRLTDGTDDKNTGTDDKEEETVA